MKEFIPKPSSENILNIIPNTVFICTLLQLSTLHSYFEIKSKHGAIQKTAIVAKISLLYAHVFHVHRKTVLGIIISK